LAFIITVWEFSSAKDLFALRKDEMLDLKEIIFYFESETQIKEYLSNSNIKVNYEI
jgi:hypothetical protein